MRRRNMRAGRHPAAPSRTGLVRLVVAVASTLAASAGAEPLPKIAAVPLPRAHAHNDYEHARPLWDALGQGFCSLEADIHLVDGQLLVGHDREQLEPGRTLQSLYLEPLRRLAGQNRGRIYPNGPIVTLLIDIKSDGKATYEALEPVLAQYADLLTRVDGDRVRPGAVQVIISGNRPKEVIAGSRPRLAAIDGRLSDLNTRRPVHLMPLISDNWRNHFAWRGDGPMPADEEARLRQLVRKVHAEDRRVRFWGSPDREPVWRVLYAAGVDLINTDDLPGLRRFLAARSEHK